VDKRGVVIFGVDDGKLARGRVYLEQPKAGDKTWREVYEVDGENITN
jgi:hypothetical protein